MHTDDVDDNDNDNDNDNYRERCLTAPAESRPPSRQRGELHSEL